MTKRAVAEGTNHFGVVDGDIAAFRQDIDRYQYRALWEETSAVLE
jgi:hypothetical protein